MTAFSPVRPRMSFLIDDLLRDTHDADKKAADTPAEVTTGFPRYCFPPVSSSSDEDSSDGKETEQAPGELRTKVMQKKNRPSFAPYQVARLKRVFTHRNYLTKQERKQLAVELNMKDEQVKTWFQNKRTKLKKKMAHDDEQYAQLLYLNDLISGASPQNHHTNQSPVPPHGYHAYQSMQPSLDQSQMISRDYINNPSVPCRFPYIPKY
ncbi:homeobox protein Nkx-3.1-like [Actinia tenebrosa]|uniref:Homeobox protein Nkx-3.1-like n=1 Tax=Actinia tenebrosa TaxID=6105 RepID=A0A6P8HHL1_ACTTE|nr:homeobox protein Nkx-3.1-like [Actinia tenebrosa]